MTTQKKPPKKEAKKFIQSKTYFTSPFSAQWSSLPQEDMHFILNTVKDKLISTGFQKKEERVFCRWRKKKDDPSPETKNTEEVKNGWTDVSVRQQLTIGINEATKALERNELQLLLVCKSVKPKHMTEHLITLSASRGVPACQVPRLSLTVGEALGLKSVLALGFRCCPENQLFTDVINAIKPRVPALEVAWLQQTSTAETPQESSDMKEEDGERRRLKRKLESKTEQEVSSLLPLKVKRIVANPEKKRNKKPQKVK